MRTFLLLCTLGLFACDFQDDALIKTKEPVRSVPQIDTSDFERSFERYLELYVVEDSNPNIFDTLVRYKKMHELSNNTNSAEASEYQELRKTVNDYFAGLDYESLNKEEKKAHLINAYNFFVMDYMARNYSTVTSIVAAGENVFGEVPFQFANQIVSLDYLEKVLLYNLVSFEKGPETREVLNIDKKITVEIASKIDARFHFAVICGAKGCPILNTELYYGDRLDDQLTDITEKGFLLKRNLDQSNGSLKLTQLFEWYRSDFDNHVETAQGQKVNNFYEFIDLYSQTIAARVSPQTIPYDWERNGTDQ